MSGPGFRAGLVNGMTSAALDDYGLSVWAFRLYHTMQRRAGGADGVMWEGVEAIATRCRMSQRQVHRGLRELEERGLCERAKRKGETSVYRPLFPFVEPGEAQPLPGGQTPPATQADGVCHTGRQRKSQEGSPQKEDPSVGKADDAPELSPDKRFAQQKEAVVALWNAERGELAGVKVVSVEIEKKLRQLLKRHTFEELRQMIEAAAGVVRRDPHWLGKKAPPKQRKREGPPYGLINLLRHVEDYANQAFDEAEEAGDLSEKLRKGSTWYTDVGIVKVVDVSSSSADVVVVRALSDAHHRGERISLKAAAFRNERIV